METNAPLPSWEGGKGISRKIIILFTIMIMSLSTLFLPYPISSLFYTTSYAAEFINTDKTVVLQAREMNGFGSIIENYEQNLIKQGYQNVTKKINRERLKQDFMSVGVQLSPKPRDYVLKAFDFYANFVQLTNEEQVYFFKTIEEANKFIDDVNQYIQTSYEIQEKVKKEIGSETKEDELAEVITEAKEQAEEIERRKRWAAAAYTVVDTSDISDAEIVQFAIQFVGNPYVYGGTSLTNGADCSGFVQSVYSRFGISLPRGAEDQSCVGRAVSFDELQPGDLVFYGNGRYEVDHVGMYIGGSKIIHAGTPATGINICTVNIMTKICARRFL